MSRCGKFVVLVALLSAAAGAARAADTVTLRDGSELPGRVVLLDDRQLVLERPDGARQSIERRELRAIAFGAEAAPRLVARVRVVEGDDEVRILLDGREIASPAELRAGWVDLAPLLRDGANQLTAEVRNGSGPWAYRWIVEAGAKKEVFACGLANRSGCREQGGNGLEKGTFPAGTIWIYVRRAAGEAVLQRP